MKVRVSITVDVDPHAWHLNYGVDAADLRADVRSYIENLVVAQLTDTGVLRDPRH